jgi:Flp pilus assembly protein TadG
VELVLVTPVLLAFLLLVVVLGRLTETRGDVSEAARDAARWASVARNAPGAERAATDAARATLSESSVTCRTLVVQVDTTEFRPGGTVATEVTCTVDLSDLSVLALPSSRTITARFVAPVDRYRGVTDEA